MIETVARVLLWSVNGVVLAYFLLLNGSHLGLSLVAFTTLRRHLARLGSSDAHDFVGVKGAPPIALIAPAYNEEATCVEAVRSLLALEYPEHEIIMVNDGSKDRTLERLLEEFEMSPAPRMATSDLPTAPIRGTYRSRRHPNLWVVDKENGGGKADALNGGLRYCQAPLFCALDADTIVERGALIRVVRPFIEDRTTVAAGGVVRIVNGCRVEAGRVTEVRLPRSFLARFQVLEYLRAFLAGRMGWHALGTTLIVSGAFGVFRRSTVVDAGGFATDTVGEDMELVVRLHRHCRERGIPYRISFVPDPVAWTEAPERVRDLGRQRDRWQRGLSEALTRHRVMLLNPRYGRVGMVAFPYFYFLEMFGPAIELVGFLAFGVTLLLGWAPTLYVIAFLMVSIALGVALSLVAVALEEITFRRYVRFRDLLGLFGLALLENVGYRQLVTYWRIKGMVSFLRGEKGWGTMARKGFGAAALVLLALPVAAQPPEGRRWEAGLSHERIRYLDPPAAWEEDGTDTRARLLRRFESGALELSARVERRFGAADASGALDAYRDLWEGAYANARVGVAPDAEIVARTDAYLELTQALPRDLEGSAGVRHARYRRDRVTVASGAVARYQGPWYLRGAVFLTPKGGETAVSFGGVARRFLAGPGDLVELGVGVGREVVTLGEGPIVELRTSRSAALRGVRWVGSGVGLEATVRVASIAGVPTGVAASVGILGRW